MFAEVSDTRAFRGVTSVTPGICNTLSAALARNILSLIGATLNTGALAVKYVLRTVGEDREIEVERPNVAFGL
jgi:hypothetical protein